MGTPLCDRCKNYILTTNLPICPYCHTVISPSTSSPSLTSIASTDGTSALYSSCPTCAMNSGLPPAYSVGTRSGLLDLLLHEYKYDSVRALAHPLAELLDHRLPAFTTPVCLVPLPTATHHIRSRGFDHTYTLARHLARLRGYPVARLLVRAKNTTQVGASRDQRLQQAHSAYQLAERIQLSPSTTYLLLDDITTTGASLQAATKRLRQAGAKNTQIAVALLAVSRQ